MKKYEKDKDKRAVSHFLLGEEMRIG